jgi:1-aminocyclopropane-1-carboxylate deaminase/D-cysteine desulfhydrase-like pyridoxal-dependent ACC family enzyme
MSPKLEITVLRPPNCKLALPGPLQACGSGGTTAGLALGLRLSGSDMAMTSYGVCDSPEVFYSDVNSLLEGLGHDTGSGMTACRLMTRKSRC